MIETPLAHRASRESRGRAFFPCLDGYRALAALAVLVLHASVISGFVFREHALGEYLSRLDVGVSIFFLISGFLMYRPFVMAHLGARAQPGLRDYFVGRFLRIYPAYWAALIAVVWVFQQPGPSHRIENVGDFVAYFGLLQQYSARHAYGGIQQAWTLCVEVAFYVFIPIWAWAIGAIARRFRSVLRWELIGLAVLFVTGIAYRMIVLSIDPTNRVEISWLPAFLDQFALGMLLAVVSAAGETGDLRSRAAALAGRHPWVCWGIAAVCFWAVSTRFGLPVGYPTLSRGEWLAWTLGYGLTAFFLLLPAVFGDQQEGLLRRALRHRVVVFVGVVSFGIYLWHELWLDRFFQTTGAQPFFPGANFVAVAVYATALSVLVAWASWSLLERPVMRLRGRLSGRPSPGRVPTNDA